MVLVTGQDPDLLAEGDEVLEPRPDLVELRPDRLLEIIVIPVHAIRGIPSDLAVRRTFSVCCSGETALIPELITEIVMPRRPEDLDEPRQLVDDPLGLDVPLGPDRGLDQVTPSDARMSASREYSRPRKCLVKRA